MAVTRFGILRHARTEWNAAGRIQGHRDSPLIPDGERRAAAWGAGLADLGWDHLLTSDQGRAVATADRINAVLKLPVAADPRLREQHWGDWAGMTLSEIAEAHPEALQAARTAGWRFLPPGGEEREAVWERSREALVEAAGRWPGARVLVVTHSGVIRSLIYRLLGRRFLPDEPKVLSLEHLHWVEVSEGGPRLAEINAVPLP